MEGLSRGAQCSDAVSLSLVSSVSRGRAVQKWTRWHLDYYSSLTKTRTLQLKARFAGCDEAKRWRQPLGCPPAVSLLTVSVSAGLLRGLEGLGDGGLGAAQAALIRHCTRPFESNCTYWTELRSDQPAVFLVCVCVGILICLALVSSLFLLVKRWSVARNITPLSWNGRQSSRVAREAQESTQGVVYFTPVGLGM